MAEATETTLAAIVPIAPVADVRRSIDFYEQLGFVLGRHPPKEAFD